MNPACNAPIKKVEDLQYAKSVAYFPISTVTTGRLPPSCCTEEGKEELGINCGFDYSVTNREKNERRYFQKVRFVFVNELLNLFYR